MWHYRENFLETSLRIHIDHEIFHFHFMHSHNIPCQQQIQIVEVHGYIV